MSVSFCAGCPCAKLGLTDTSACGPETGPNIRYLIVGDAPGHNEIREGRPFVDLSGSLLQKAFQGAGVRRDECHLTNAILCRPPKNNIEAAKIQVRRWNKANKESPQLAMPVEACQKRLYTEVAQTGVTNVICLGKEAAQAIRGGTLSIRAMRGACEELPAPWDETRTLKVAYLMHPAHVVRAPQWEEVFLRDFDRAIRFFAGSLDWKEPVITISNDYLTQVSAIARFVDAGKPVAYDVETELKGPIDSRTRCIAIANEDEALVVPIRSVTGKPLVCRETFLDRIALDSGILPDELAKTLAPLLDFLDNPPVPLVGHNAGQFDRMHMNWAWGVDAKVSVDTMVLHLLTNNELPHNLGFVGSHHTDFTEAWKADHTATEAGSDKELHVYCGKDAVVTARVVSPLIKCVKERSQEHLVQREMMLMELGALMQSNGMAVDVFRAQAHNKKLQKDQEEDLVEICSLLQDPEFNPNSHQQVQRLLFQDWGLTPYKYSDKTGDPSADDESLRRMITEYGLSKEHNEVLRRIRTYRRASKLRGTFVEPLLTVRGQGGLRSDRTGRVHPSWNRLPATGRYSSNDPNAQNIPDGAIDGAQYGVRDCYVSNKGLLVGADMDQLEYRVIAEEAKAINSLKWVNEGLDPHNETMEIIYGDSIWSLPGAPETRKKKGGGDFKATRDITKNVRYAWQYWAAPKRIWEQVVSVEDAQGNLIYAHLTLQDIREVVHGLNRADPEIPIWWRKIEARFRREGFIADSLWGRRRYFRGEDKPNDRVNHPIQAGGCVIVNEAMIELVYGPQPWFTTVAIDPPGTTIDPEWLINHGHDALYLDVPESRAKEAEEILERAMTRRRRDNPLLDYTAGAKSGYRWSDL